MKTLSNPRAVNAMCENFFFWVHSTHHNVGSLDCVFACQENAFTPTTGDLKEGNFKDHDDANVIFDAPAQRWVEMQIMCACASRMLLLAGL